MRAWRFLSGGSARLSGAALGQAVAFAVHLKNADMVGDAVEQRAGQTLGSQRFRPFVKRKIAGDQGVILPMVKGMQT